MAVTVALGPEGTAQAVLDGTGAGTAKVGPLTDRENWTLATASVSCSSNVLEAACRIFVGDVVTAANYVDGTLSGSTGDSTDNVAAAPCPKGTYVWAVWTGGDAGAVATLSVNGTKTI
jgi:hypothetical protein